MTSFVFFGLEAFRFFNVAFPTRLWPHPEVQKGFLKCLFPWRKVDRGVRLVIQLAGWCASSSQVDGWMENKPNQSLKVKAQEERQPLRPIFAQPPDHGLMKSHGAH